MYVSKYEVDVTTDAAGNGTAYTPIVNGRILNVIYDKDGTVPYDAGVDVNVSIAETGQSVWVESNVDASAVRAPRQKTHYSDGTEVLYAAAGTNVEDYIVSAGDRLKITVAAGGDTKTGKFTVIVG